jgi:hypothetical protein
MRNDVRALRGQRGLSQGQLAEATTAAVIADRTVLWRHIDTVRPRCGGGARVR